VAKGERFRNFLSPAMGRSVVAPSPLLPPTISLPRLSWITTLLHQLHLTFHSAGLVQPTVIKGPARPSAQQSVPRMDALPQGCGDADKTPLIGPLDRVVNMLRCRVGAQRCDYRDVVEPYCSAHWRKRTISSCAVRFSRFFGRPRGMTRG
jgi:hypothetical protein